MSDEPVMRSIINGRECPYCKQETEWVSDTEIYSRSYGGMIYLCCKCDAYVGCHKGEPTKALGRLANKELREAKIEAHSYFDHLWNRKIAKGFSKAQARAKAYKWLSKQMGTKPEYTHIGMFDIEQCLKVVELCKPYKK